jgi:hypothetical protein
MHHLRRQRGQASVELVAVLPIVALLSVVLWQGVLAGEAAWLGGSAARAAARAQAVGGDPLAAARRVLPANLERGVAVHADQDGAVRVSIPVPFAVGGGRLATIVERAELPSQETG